MRLLKSSEGPCFTLQAVFLAAPGMANQMTLSEKVLCCWCNTRPTKGRLSMQIDMGINIS